jgi:L-lactate dehydrogenase complex protein LldG
MQTFKTSKARENILRRIRTGLNGNPVPMPFPEAEKTSHPIYANDGLAPEEKFAEAFIALGGKFIFCDREQDALDKIIMLHESREWNQLLCAEQRWLKLFQSNNVDIVSPVDPAAEQADACITGCDFLIARTGSVMLSSMQHMGRTASAYFPVHIVVAYVNQVVPDIENGLAAIKKKYGSDLPSMINLTTGPSRTADIEKTLVVGVHGPGEIFCFLVNAEI